MSLFSPDKKSTARRRVLVLLATIASSALTGSLAPGNDRDLPREFSRTVLAAELVRDSEVDLVYGKPDTAARMEFGEQLTKSIRTDYLFIVFYTLLFVELSRIAPARTAAMVLAVIAGLADVGENLGMSSLAGGSDATFWAREPSLLKWGSLGVVWIILGRHFLMPGRAVKGWRWLWDLAFVAAAFGGWATGGATWRFAAFVLPLAYMAYSLRALLQHGEFRDGDAAMRGLAGFALLSAGVISVFSVLFANARLELALPLAALALVLLLALYTAQWIRAAYEPPGVDVSPAPEGS